MPADARVALEGRTTADEFAAAQRLLQEWRKAHPGAVSDLSNGSLESILEGKQPAEMTLAVLMRPLPAGAPAR